MLREFNTTKPALNKPQELLQAENKRPQLETRKLQITKLISKGKHKAKVGNHPHTNMISKPATVRRVQMQYIGNAFEIQRPETLNNLVHIQNAISKPHGNHKPKIYN